MPSRSLLAIALAICLSHALALADEKPQAAQPNPPAQIPGAGPGGVKVGIDPAQFRQQQIDLIKQSLQPTDEQWNTLLPKIEKVLEAQRNIRSGAGMSFSTNMNRGQITRTSGGGNATVDTATGKALQEIRDALTEEATSDADILKKLAALREEKAKAKAQVVEAQQELKAACTPRQEAVLVTLGQLD